MYGQRGKIGLITLASDTSVLPEFQRLMPKDVQVYPAPILLPRGEVTAAALSEMLESDQLERAASLLAWAEVGVILFACTSGSLVHGPGWDSQISDRIIAASGISSTTTTTAVLETLRLHSAKRLIVATPYLDEINEIERDFFNRSGFDVLAIAGLECATDHEIGRLAPADAIDLIARIAVPDVDAIFISCTNWHVVEAVLHLEQHYGIPVITSNLAGAWRTLAAVGVEEEWSRMVLRGASG